MTTGAAREIDVVVVGAGQAGLSAAYFLQRLGVPAERGFVVLDADAAPGGAWQHRWESLRMRTVHRIADLPGLPFEQPGPDAVAAEALPAYFAAYEERFGLPVHRPVRVRAVQEGRDERLDVLGDSGSWSARAVVNATGTWTRPFWPYYPGRETFRGRQLHTADYRGPDELAGRRVVVVGGGASAVQLLAEVSLVARTTWVTRRPPVWRDAPFDEEAGRAAVALVEQAVRSGRPPASVVSVTGLVESPAVAEARARGALERLPMFDRILPEGVAWADGRSLPADVILWCTGFRAALDHLAPLRLRLPAGGIAMDGTRPVGEPRLHLVGYGPSASTIGAARAGRQAAREVVALLAGASRHAGPGDRLTLSGGAA
ncbi:NAD(P)-binding domain-containing protein [Motilibacter aurantiacus]|uniref:NAD(P)-binding domain-containing protein n=1 Tax=Motilibacter aurantiacus TaxID=2714955 RepID=UPI00140976D6|nr:NAD(P)-binding domain-containing protein [Motilibacter aurantiacus]NHC44467.1 NAD(P)/FAD-dependent oxidoreductase [Motilibacter aurantiacus]